MPEPGPLFWFTSFADVKAPFYAIRFDKFGELASPKTVAELVKRLESNDFTDVIVCAHGWNNIWKDALANYKGFIDRLAEIHARTGVRPTRPYRPLVIGVFWPSTSLVLPWEQGPRIAGQGGGDAEVLDEWEVDDQSVVAESVAPGDLAEFYELSEADTLDAAGARRLAELLLSAAGDGEDELPTAATETTVEDVLDTWREYSQPNAAGKVAPGRGGRRVPADEDPDAAAEAGREDAGAPVAAGAPDLDPRAVLRLFTVRTMKDRAGKVGVRGVGDLLRRTMAAAHGAHFHLVGHSYGARVLLNAVARPDGGPLPPVRSLLLLQPAVNHLCFAEELAELGGAPGGYRAALDRVEQPVLTTFTRHDFPLRKVFHHALFRPGDIGEILVAGDDDPPPSIYAALGGYGPRRIPPSPSVTMKEPAGAPAEADFYDLTKAAPQVTAINGTALISGHGDVITTATAWALLNLLLAE
ncbi:alpha/beta fold hydrolase [Microbacterium sp. B2969]|uniref:Alpha/beta fold hydrolase n=1 Tax=Microbacterium alkaliflavum TaxID=3248839 RepID=A0ABW7Q9B8_9MICO